jgi:hypothetical protein
VAILAVLKTLVEPTMGDKKKGASSRFLVVHKTAYNFSPFHISAPMSLIANIAEVVHW